MIRRRGLGRRELRARLRRALRELRSDGRRPAEAPPSASEHTAREFLLDALERGRSLEQAVAGQVRRLLDDGDADAARALAESLRARDATAPLGHLAAGLVAFREGYPELAWDELRRLPRETWTALASTAYVRSGLAVAPADALRELRALIAADPPYVSARAWFDVLAPLYGRGESELARAAFAIFDRRVREDARGWDGAAAHRDWLRDWIALDPDSPTAPDPARPSFAVMDYGHPGANRASANIGDHIQSIAALGHLVRHRGVRLHGPHELVDVLRALGDRTRPERARHNVDADLEVLTVHRDASMYQAIPRGTWVLCFGWYMHALFGVRHGFPLHRNLRPIFVSFHCNKRALLTPAALEYLRRYGPVGCRDWTTVYLLLSTGVPAFFSGCLTTTIDTVFGDLEQPPAADAPVAYVDAVAGPDDPAGKRYGHSSPAVRRRSFVANLRVALDRLDTYRSRHSRVATSRLHCYLPLRSIGTDVEFRPANRSDVRFDGLLDVDDDAFDAMRGDLLGKLEPVMAAVLNGRPEAEVYALWRDLTASDVAAARERLAAEPRVAPARANLPARIDRALAETVAHHRAAGGAGPVDVGVAGDTAPVDVAVLLPKGGGRSLEVLAASLLEHASRPLHLRVLALSASEPVMRRLAARFPELAVTWVPAGRLRRDPQDPAGPRLDAETAARLLIGELLPAVGRVVLLPLPAVATGDVAELADLDLGAHALAAARLPGAGVSGFGLIHAAAARLGDRTTAAAELRRTAHARHRFDFDAFGHDVLVLDLERLRRDGFGARALALVDAFGLSAPEALHYLIGPDRAAIPDRWAVVPTRTPRREGGLIHWADGVKPWQPRLTPERDRWRRYAAGGPTRAA